MEKDVNNLEKSKSAFVARELEGAAGGCVRSHSSSEFSSTSKTQSPPIQLRSDVQNGSKQQQKRHNPEALRRSRCNTNEEMVFQDEQKRTTQHGNEVADLHTGFLPNGTAAGDDQGTSSSTTGTELLGDLDARLFQYVDLENKFEKHRNKSHQKICSLEVKVQCLAAECKTIHERLVGSQMELADAKSVICKKEVENENLRRSKKEQEEKYSQKMLSMRLELERANTKLKLLQEGNDDEDPYNMNAGSPKYKSFNQGSLRAQLMDTMALAHKLQTDRDKLERSKEDLEQRLKEVDANQHVALIDYNKSKMADDAKIVNLKSLVDVKNMELNRQNLMLEEYHKKFQRANELNEALKDKINDLTLTLNRKTCELNEEITRLALELESKTTRLELYEKLEADLDVMILKAAAVPGDSSRGDLRSVCSFGNGLPTDSKRRLQQAFDLAKRNCDLEKTVAEVKEELMKSYDVRNQLRGEISTLKASIPRDSGQLLDALIEMKRDVSKLNHQLAASEKQLQEANDKKELLQMKLNSLQEFKDELLKVHQSGARIVHAKRDLDPRVDSSVQTTENSAVEIENRNRQRKEGIQPIENNQRQILTHPEKNVVKGRAVIRTRGSMYAQKQQPSKIGSETESEIEAKKVLAKYKASSISHTRRDGFTDTISQTARTPPLVATMHLARRFVARRNKERGLTSSNTCSTTPSSDTCNFILEPKSLRSSFLETITEEVLKRNPRALSRSRLHGESHDKVHSTVGKLNVATSSFSYTQTSSKSMNEGASNLTDDEKRKKKPTVTGSDRNVPLRKSKVRPSKSVKFF